MRLCLLLGLIFSMVVTDPPTTLLRDTFFDGNYTVAEGSSGMTWTVLSGSASVSGGQLAINRPGFIVCDQQISTNEFTIQFDATITWSEPGRFVFLYKDSSNYYWMGLGNVPGVFRVMNGAEEQLYVDSGSKLRLPHAGPATNTCKIYVHNTGSAIDLKFDRGGDGVDYDVELTDSTSAAAALFQNTGVGAYDSTTNSGSNFKLDNILIRNYEVVDARSGTVYYVDAAAGDDSRTGGQAANPATPWKTIQKGVDSAFSKDTVLVKSGVYRESVTPPRSGKASAPITIKAFDPANKPVLDGSDFVNSGDWQATTVTNLNGVTYAAYKTPITWNPGACYQNGIQMFASQEPNQSVPDDAYDLSAFRAVPAEFNPGTSQTVLKDPAFFTQVDSNYWVGASLLLYDGAGNFIVERKITQYIPEENTVVVQKFDSYIGSNSNAGDKYAIRYHSGCLDQPGEFYVDTNQTPSMLYIMPYEGVPLSLVSAGKKNYAFNLSSGYRSGIIMDGFDIRFYTNNSVTIQTGCEDVIVRNCDIHHNMAGGVSVRGASRIRVESSRLYANYDNGVSFGDGSDYSVENCEITANGNNGIWAGSGSSVNYFVTDGVTVRGCYIHHQDGRRSHADNYQMQQCRNVLLENNVFIQSGEQNMWCQYSDNFVLRNNIFMGGPLGLGAVMHNYLYNNIFYNSSLRYDAHLTDSPFGDHYLQQHVEIKNNSIIESGISWPPMSLVDRYAVFTVDHNYYNIESSHTRSIWDFSGYRLGVNQGGSMLIASPQIAAGGKTAAAFEASVTWSAWGRFICMYKDPDNYYSFGLGTDAGIFRKLNGVETKVYTDTGSLIRMPHSSGRWDQYKVQMQNTGAAIEIKIAHDQTDETWDAEYSDTNIAATAAFDSFRIGIMTSDTNYDVPKTFIDSVELSSEGTGWIDAFEDGDYTIAAGTNGMVWTAVSGAGVVSYVGGSGVGYGSGSILHTNRAMLSQLFVQPPDALNTNYNFRLTANSPLRDAGVDVGIASDKDGRTRTIGTAPDIGPYEYDLSVAASGGQTPVLIAADPDSGVFALRGVQSETVSIVTASGSPVGEVAAAGGAVKVDTQALSMKPGLYRIAAGDRTLKVILL